MRGWKMWGLCLVPVAGVALAYALPPIDEYAAIDRLAGAPSSDPGLSGTGISSGAPDGRLNLSGRLAISPAAVESAYGAPSQARDHFLVWRFSRPLEEVLRFRGRFLSRRRDWQRTDVEGGAYGPGFRRVSFVKESYLNTDTGDRLQWTEESWNEGGRRQTAYIVFVERRESSLPLRSKLWRWLRTAFI